MALQTGKSQTMQDGDKCSRCTLRPGSQQDLLLSELCDQIFAWTNMQTVPVRIPAMPQDKFILCRAFENKERQNGDADEFYDFVSEECLTNTEDSCVHGPTAGLLYQEAIKLAPGNTACLNYWYSAEEFLATLSLDKQAQFEQLLAYVHYHSLDCEAEYGDEALQKTVLPLFRDRCVEPHCYFGGVRYDGEGGLCGLPGPIALPATSYRLARSASSKSRVICQLRSLRNLHRRMFVQQELPKVCLLCMIGKHNQAVNAQLNGEVEPHSLKLPGLQLFLPKPEFIAQRTTVKEESSLGPGCSSSESEVRTLSPFHTLILYKLDRIIASLRISCEGSGQVRFI